MQKIKLDFLRNYCADLIQIFNESFQVEGNFFFFFFFIQFNVPFKIISLIETSQSIGGAKREYPGKTT